MLSLLYSSIISAYALEPATVYSWIGSNAPAYHAKFFHDYGNMSEEFHSTLLKWSNTQLKRAGKSAVSLHASDQCNEGALFKSISPKSVTSTSSELESRFIDSLFMIETSYCIPDVTLQHAYDVFMSKEFRLDVMPQVIGFTKTANGACVRSDGVTGILLPSEYCTDHRQTQDDRNILLYSSLYSAYTDEDHQPLYFREEIILFSQLSNGVAVYRMTFSRSGDLGSTTKYLLRNTVSSSQGRIRDGYYEWLQK